MFGLVRIVKKLKIILVLLFIVYIYIFVLSSFTSNSITNPTKASVRPTSITTTKMVQNDDIFLMNWIIIDTDNYILKAYLDKRKETHFVRIITIFETSLSFQCKFIDENSEVFVDALSYEFNENHSFDKRGFIYSCEVPQDRYKNMYSVTLFYTPTQSKIVLPLQVLQIKPPKYNFTLCIPPIYGQIDHLSLISFIEMNRLLGAEHFYFYLDNIYDKKVLNVLKYYKQLKIVSLNYWNLPFMSRTIWNHGQMPAIHHCLYRNIGLSKYTIFQDIDELLVPQNSEWNWEKMMEVMDESKNHCGYRVNSVFMIGKNYTEFKYIDVKMRNSATNKVRTKCIVRPELIFEQGIHHISKQNVEEMTPKNAPTDYALIYHYRECLSSYGGDNCKELIKDTKLVHWENKLRKRYHNVKESIDNFNYYSEER